MMAFALDVARENVVIARLAIASVEIAALGMAVWLLTRHLLKQSPRLAALCWLLVLTKGLLSLFIEPALLLGGLDEQDPVDTMSAPSAPVVVVEGLRTAKVDGLPAGPMAVGEMAVMVWFGGVLLLTLLTLRDVVRGRRVAVAVAPERVQERARDEARFVGLASAPKVWLSDVLQSPALLGFFRPKVVIPRWLGEADASELAWVLRHELTHLRHGDHLANGIRRGAGIVFFFHPVVWYASRRWEEDVEYACDRALTKTPVQARDYAQRLFGLLTRIQQGESAALSSGLYASRTQVGRRIEALLRPHDGDRSSRSWRGRLIVAGVALIALFVGISSPEDWHPDVIGGKEDHRHRFQTEFAEQTFTSEYEIRAAGMIGFSEGHESITSMSDGARLTCNVRTLTREFSINVSPGPSGAIEIGYRVDGDVRELDARGRTWLRRAIGKIGRRWDSMQSPSSSAEEVFVTTRAS